MPVYHRYVARWTQSLAKIWDHGLGRYKAMHINPAHTFWKSQPRNLFSPLKSTWEIMKAKTSFLTNLRQSFCHLKCAGAVHISSNYRYAFICFLWVAKHDLSVEINLKWETHLYVDLQHIEQWTSPFRYVNAKSEMGCCLRLCLYRQETQGCKKRPEIGSNNKEKEQMTSSLFNFIIVENRNVWLIRYELLRE